MDDSTDVLKPVEGFRCASFAYSWARTRTNDTDEQVQEATGFNSFTAGSTFKTRRLLRPRQVEERLPYVLRAWDVVAGVEERSPALPRGPYKDLGGNLGACFKPQLSSCTLSPSIE